MMMTGLSIWMLLIFSTSACGTDSPIKNDVGTCDLADLKNGCKLSNPNQLVPNSTLRCCLFNKGLSDDGQTPEYLKNIQATKLLNSEAFSLTAELNSPPHPQPTSSVVFYFFNSSIKVMDDTTRLPNGTMQISITLSNVTEHNNSLTWFAGNINAPEGEKYNEEIVVVEDRYFTLRSTILTRVGYLTAVVYKTNDLSKDLGEEIVYTYDLSVGDSLDTYGGQPIHAIEYQCVKYEGNQTWSDAGCENTTRVTSTSISCTCNRSGIIGIRRTVETTTWLDALTPILVFLSILLILVCILFIVSTALVFVLRKKKNFQRTFVQLGVCITFFGLSFISVLSNLIYFSYPTPTTMCEYVAFFQLYFRFTISWWILNEGIVLFLKIGLAAYVNYENLATRARVIVFTGMVWVLPAVILGPTVAIELQSGDFLPLTAIHTSVISKNNAILANHPGTPLHNVDIHSKYMRCWGLSSSISFRICLAAIAIAFCLNFVICVYLSVEMWRKAGKTTTPTPKSCCSRIMTTAEATFTLSWFLGLPTFLTLLLRITELLDEMYSKIIIPDLMVVAEGVFLFYFYFLRNSDARKSLKASLHRLKLRISGSE